MLIRFRNPQIHQLIAMNSENEQEFFTLTSNSKHLAQRRRSPKLPHKHLKHRTSVYLFGGKTTESIMDIFEFSPINGVADEAEVKYFQ